MSKFSKIIKGLVAGVSLFSLSGVSALAVSVLAADDTTLTLSVTSGSLTVTSPATVALTGVSIAATPQNSTASIAGVNVVDLRGSNAGWTLTAKFRNLALGTPNADDNILMGSALDATGGAAYTGTSYLAITNSALTDNTAGVGAPIQDLSLSANPVYETLSAIDNTGETQAMTVLVAEVNEGAGDYDFDMDVQLTIPAYGRYGFSNKKVGGGSYSGNITFDFL
jgi:hypothetical protein